MSPVDINIGVRGEAKPTSERTVRFLAWACARVCVCLPTGGVPGIRVLRLCVCLCVCLSVCRLRPPPPLAPPPARGAGARRPPGRRRRLSEIGTFPLHQLIFPQFGNRVLKVFVFPTNGDHFSGKVQKRGAFGLDMQTFLSNAFRVSEY